MILVLQLFTRAAGASASPAVQYVSSAYLTSFITLGLLYAGLPSDQFPLYAQVQGAMNIVIVASALGIPTAAAHLGLLSSDLPAYRFSMALEQTGIQFLVSTLLAAAVMLPMASSSAASADTAWLAFALTASSGLYPLWGVGVAGFCRHFAVALLVLKSAQWLLLLHATAASRLKVWMISQSVIYVVLFGMFLVLGARQRLRYAPTGIAWRRVIPRAARSDLVLDALKAVWANWLQLAGAAAGPGAQINALLLLDRLGKAMTSFLDNSLRLRWYGAMRARGLAGLRDLYVVPVAVLAAVLGLAVLAELGAVSAFALSVALMGAAALLGMLNGASEWHCIRGAFAGVRARSVAVALACIAAAGLSAWGRETAPTYLVLCLAVVLGEMIIALQTQRAGRERRI